MPFNGSGTFSIINTFVPNTTILSAAVNQNFSDIATGLSDCLTRDGQAGMSAVFKAVSGSLGAPGISFNSDTTAGMYLSATGIVGLVAKSLGLLVNSGVYQVSAAAVQTGGSNYAVGDTITLTGGTAVAQAVLTVATLSGSAVATVTVTYPGNYTVKPSDPVAQGSTSGSGSSATFNLTWTTQYTRSVVTSEAGALPWQRLGSSSYMSGLMAKANAYDLMTAIATFSSGFSINKGTSPPTLTTTLNPTLVPGYMNGLTLSTAGASTTMTIAAGVANDSTASTLMNLSASIAKTTASWAVGTGNGGLDTGSIANSTTYHFYEIYRPDTAVVDVCFSTSASAPTFGSHIPSAYTLYRVIGSCRTNGSGQWTKFVQVGNVFLLDVPVLDVDSSSITNSASTVTLTSVPTGVKFTAIGNIMSSCASNGYVLASSLDVADAAPSNTAAPGATTSFAGGSAIGTWVGGFQIRTDTSSQIRVRSTVASTTVRFVTTGWIDPRIPG